MCVCVLVEGSFPIIYPENLFFVMMIPQISRNIQIIASYGNPESLVNII